MAAILPSNNEPQPLADPAPISLLTAQNCTGHIHLILGTNPLASSRVSHSISSGAKPVVVAPPDSEIHYALQRRIDEGHVQWHQKVFQEDDLFNLGREDVGKVVDAVFITSAPRDAKRTC
jgi:uroporphyrin-III C-methyltransferase